MVKGAGLVAIKNLLRRIEVKIFKSNSPSVFIVGAQKSGTSTLHNLLSMHPNVSSGLRKEVGYFHRDIHFGVSIDEYRNYFPGWKRKLYMDATPEYLYHPDVAKNIHEFYPDAKLIVILRDPVSRAYSAWNHYRDHFYSGKHLAVIKLLPRVEGNKLYESFYQNRKDFPSFRECVDIELEYMKSNEVFEPGILRRGLYLEQLNAYWNYFSKEQILLVGFKDLVLAPEDVMSTVERFLGLKSFSVRGLKTGAKNQRSYKERISAADKLFLNDFYSAPNIELFNEVGQINW